MQGFSSNTSIVLLSVLNVSVLPFFQYFFFFFLSN